MHDPRHIVNKTRICNCLGYCCHVLRCNVISLGFIDVSTQFIVKSHDGNFFLVKWMRTMKMNNEWERHLGTSHHCFVGGRLAKKMKATSTVVPFDVNAKYKIQILTYLNKPTPLTQDWSNGFTSTLCVFVKVFWCPSVRMRHMRGIVGKRSFWLISGRLSSTLKTWREVNIIACVFILLSTYHMSRIPQKWLLDILVPLILSWRTRQPCHLVERLYMWSSLFQH